MPDDQTELKRAVERAGLTNLSGPQLAQAAKAKAAAEQLVQRIPRDLHMYDEPAHIFRASEEA